MSAEFNKFRDRGAFTLMELMIVLVIIGILIASVFKLFSAVSENTRRAQTKARMERLQNAISGFYSSYGTYPPVPQYSNPDPFNASDDRGDDGGKDIPWSGAGKANAAIWAARSQPVSFEYPYPQTYDEFVNEKYGPMGIGSANEVYYNADTYKESLWEDVKMFKFGLMSFLLPRVYMVGIPAKGASFDKSQPLDKFFKSEQWMHHNKTSRIGANSSEKLLNALRGQYEQELREVAKWIPNLEGIVSGNAPTVLDTTLFGGGNVNDSIGGGSDNFRGVYAKGGQKTILFCTTVVDGWGNDFFYYSAPPYQSYRIWSAGEDGKTFPPWVPLESLSSDDLKLVSAWTKDDVVGFDR